MKRFSFAIILCFTLFRASADEGMWLPMLLGQQVYSDMVKHGLKLTKEQLYSINQPCIKDAVVIFGGGCTGEIVSNQGLIFTNHHCGYGVIAGSSTVEHNYLKDGFYAYTKDQEIKSDLTVTFLERIVDVTDQVDSALKDLNYADRAKKTAEVYKQITDKVADSANSISGKVYSMFKGNQYIMYVYKIYRDIRLVGAPPESIGKFGGDTDNWEWPRHTCDYSIFRVYTAKDGKPATYSADNVPMKPKYFLPVSLKGYKDGDYAMIFGYPGGTNRYEISYGIKLKNEIDNPSLVHLRGVRLNYMHEQMIKDPAVKLKLAESYASIANYWKFFDGETKQLEKYHVYENKQAAENKFEAWAKDKPEYQNVLNDYQKNYAAWTPYAKQRVYLYEGILGSPLIAYASSLISVERALTQQGKTQADVNNALAAANAKRKTFLEKENLVSDKEIVAATAMMFYKDIDKNQQPIGFYQGIKDKFGSLNDEATFKSWANAVFDNTMILDSAKWAAFSANPDAVTLQGDPAFAYASAFVENYILKYSKLYSDFVAKNDDLGRLYLKGIMEMNPVAAKKMYPDANFSMRVTYGNVKSYSPRDAVRYDYETTEKGILEKYIPGDYEFNLPENEINLLKKSDFGQYIDKVRNDLSY